MKLLILALGFVFVIGCGGGSTDDPDCSRVANPCDEEGTSQCDSGRQGIEACVLDGEGCLVWATAACELPMVCDDSGAAATCVCDDECGAEGDSRCVSDRDTDYETCIADEQGCLSWGDWASCMGPGLACDDSGGSAECVDICGPDCLDVMERCNGTVIEDCVQDEDGCWQLWNPSRDCADSDEVCDDSDGEPHCVDPG